MKSSLFRAAQLACGAALIAGAALYNLILLPRGITWIFGWIRPLMIGLALACFAWAFWPRRAVRGWAAPLIRAGILVIPVLGSLTVWWNGNSTETVFDRSPDGEYLLILTREEETGSVTVERPYRIFWKRKQAQLPQTVYGEIKRQWLENDICALTWEDADGELRQYIATYGDRGDSVSYLDPLVPIMGRWASESPEDPDGSGEEWTLAAEDGVVTISGEDRIWVYESEDCERYGTIALTFLTDGIPEWSLAFNQDCRVNYDDLLAEGSTLTLCRVSTGETEPVTLCATEEKEPYSETNPDLVELLDPEDEARATIDRMKAYREQLPDPDALREREGMMGIFYVPSAGDDECLNVRNALKARQEMYRVNGVDNRVQLECVRRLAGDRQDGLYEVTFTSLTISPGNQGAAPEGESQKLTWRVRLMYADGGYLAAVFFGEEEGDWGLTENPGEPVQLSHRNEYHFFLSGQYDTAYMYTWRSTPEEAMKSVWQEQLLQEYPEAVAGEFDGMPYLDLSGDGTILLLYDGISEDLQDYCFQLVRGEAGGPTLYGATELLEEYRMPMAQNALRDSF